MPTTPIVNQSVIEKLLDLRAMDEMSVVDRVALAKRFPVKELIGENGVEIGSHPFKLRVLVEMSGTLTKGEDYKQEVPNKIDWNLLALLLASAVNESTRNSVFKNYDKLMKASKNKKGAEALKKLIEEMAKKVKEEADAKISFLKHKTETKCDGKTTFADTVVSVRQIP
jgi:hypothetical protein